jgi:hypothetical protein
MLEYYFKHEYENACNTSSDINEHLPVLFEYANKVNHITELGVRWGVSTRAFLYSAVLNKTTLRSYDINLYHTVTELFDMAIKINPNVSYQQANTLDLTIEATDLLFIDTLHTYEQLSTELKLHGNKAKKYIIFHDTVTFFELSKAIDEFCEANKHWKLLSNYTNNNGLKILERY